MADKCTMFDKYPCDRLTKAYADAEEAQRFKAQYREQARALLEENEDLKRQLERARQDLAVMRGLVLQAREFLNEVDA